MSTIVDEYYLLCILLLPLLYSIPMVFSSTRILYYCSTVYVIHCILLLYIFWTDTSYCMENERITQALPLDAFDWSAHARLPPPVPGTLVGEQGYIDSHSQMLGFTSTLQSIYSYRRSGDVDQSLVREYSRRIDMLKYSYSFILIFISRLVPLALPPEIHSPIPSLFIEAELWSLSVLYCIEPGIHTTHII